MFIFHLPSLRKTWFGHLKNKNSPVLSGDFFSYGERGIVFNDPLGENLAKLKCTIRVWDCLWRSLWENLADQITPLFVSLIRLFNFILPL